MSNVTFKSFKKAVELQLTMMQAYGLYQTSIAKDDIWNLYLDSFPEGTNEIYKERREYDCTCCSQFVRTIGGVVAFVEGKKVSVWDIEVGGKYQPVINALREAVHASEVHAPFFHHEKRVGTDYNHQILEDGTAKKWEHFSTHLLSDFVMLEERIPSHLNTLKTNHDTLKRSVETLTLSSAEIVLDLIEGGLYRGEEMKARVESFIAVKTKHDSLPEEEKQGYLWEQSSILMAKGRFRNSVIGTLMVDISEGVEIETAVAKFEDKVSEGKFKRSKPVATQKMLKAANDTVVALGLEDALYRRYARLDDLTINNVLFANRDARQAMNPFENLMQSAPAKAGNVVKGGQEISIAEFMANVVPHATDIEMLVERNHLNNLVSLIAPEHASAGNMLAWDNNFSWSYRGEVTDSIRERVKKAGGNVEGVLRCSLSWTNKDDLDIHVLQPNGRKIYFSQSHCPQSGGRLDVDMNAYGTLKEDAVENIFWKSRPLEGRYKVMVHNYTKRCTDLSKDGFQIEVDDNGQSMVFGRVNNPRGNEMVTVVEFDYSHKNGVEFVKGKGQDNTKAETEWGITTGTFQKVNMIMNSPNHWDGNCIGNKHLFFSLANCRNEGESRGFYNEFLREELHPHRKSFEMLGGALKAPKSDDQVSGLGFSSTKRNKAVIRVDGKPFTVLF